MAGFESLPSLPVPAHFNEPFSAWSKPYGASPARPYGDPETEHRQELMNAEFDKLFESPPSILQIPDSFRDCLIEDEKFGRIKRNLKNHYHYEAWRKTNPSIDDSLRWEVTAYERGQASIEMIGVLAVHTTLKAFLAGKLTHVYWQRMESLPEMRQDTTSVIEFLGGTVYDYPDEQPYRSINIVPSTIYDPKTGKEEVKAIGVDYKRDFGKVMSRSDNLPINFVEQQTARYRVDEASTFPQEIIEAMNNPSMFVNESDARDFSWTNLQDPRHKVFLDLSGAREFIEDSVQSNSVEPYVVPVETIEFGFKGDNFHVMNQLGGIAIRR